MKHQKSTILYSRLSKEDERIDESLSIENQKSFLSSYAKDNGFKNVVHLIDDGFTGTRWDRPSITQLIDEIDKGNVGIVVCKDLSRLGRDFLRVELLMEKFRERDVRFIAVGDKVDTSKGIDKFAIFKNIFNEWHAQDTSDKIRAIFNHKTAEGKHVTGAIPYGYLHDPVDRQKWIVDEEAAKVIRHIFQLVIEGNGVYQIAKILEQEKVLIPTAHWESIGVPENVRHTYRDPYMWRGGVVSNILQREEYMGNKILRKGYSESFKHKKRKETPKDERLVFEGAIPQIIDPETWQLAQRLRRTVRRPTKTGEPPYRLTGLMFCATCGSKMTHDRSLDFRPGRRSKNEYVCSNYRQRTRECTMHFIRVPAVEELILDAVKSVTYYVRNNEAEFVQKVREASATRQEAHIKEHKKLLAKHKRRYGELDGLIKTLYESFATGKIPEKHFDKLMADYDTEQSTLEVTIANMQSEIDTWGADIEKTDKFIELVQKYTMFDELSNEIVNTFIEKIVVHEADRSTGKREQQVDIHLNFIGNFITPPQDIPLTPKEIAKLE